MMHDGNWEGWGMHGFGWLFWLGIAILVIWLLIGYRNRRFSRGNTHESPLEILKKRYAKGEISKEEFEEAKENLKE